ncbi:MAG: phospholipid carrier-dependent glycosyltransferase [Nitrospirota bacterium]
MTYLADFSALIYIASGISILSYIWLRRFGLLTGQTQIDIALSGGIGLGVLSCITALMAFLHLLWLPAWTVIAVPVVFTLIFNRHGFQIKELQLKTPQWNMWCWLLAGIISLHFILNLISALAPPTGVDTMVYHLSLPSIYLRKGGFEQIYTNEKAYWPQAVQMIFLYAMWLRGDVVAQLLNWWASALTGFALYGIMVRQNRRFAALLAVSLYISISDVAYQSSLALIDVPATLFMVLSFITLVFWIKKEENKWLILSGLLSGLYAGSRISNIGLVIGLGIAAALFIIHQKDYRNWFYSIRVIAIFGGCTLLVVLPWYVRSWYYMGNPVFPFLHDIFGGFYNSIEGSSNYMKLALYKTIGERSLSHFLIMPWVLTVDPGRYRSGSMGPVILSCLPLLIVYRKKFPQWAGLVLLFILVSLPIWYLTYARLRSLLSVVLILIILISMAIQFLFEDERMRRLLRFTVIMVLCLWLAAGLINNFRIHKDAVAVAMGIEDRDKYADNKLRSDGFEWYYDYKQLNKILPVDANVLLWDSCGYYLNRDHIDLRLFSYFMYDEDQLSNPSKFLKLLYSFKVTHTAWHPSEKHFDKLKEVISSSGCSSVVYNSGTIEVRRIDYGLCRALQTNGK